jgi:hypothetical protein
MVCSPMSLRRSWPRGGRGRRPRHRRICALIRCYALGESVPVEGIIAPELVELLYRADNKRRQRILRSVYECGVFQTLREKLRCREIWVVGAELR